MMDTASIARIRPSAWFRPALSLSEALALLESRLRALECARDARALFCDARTSQLRRVTALLEAGGFAGAGAWIERLEIEHTQRYMRAVDSWDRGDFPSTPAPWRLIFGRERRGESTAGESLRAGAIAHLAYDLPLALARIGTATMRGGDMSSAFVRLTAHYAESADAAARDAMARHARSRFFGRRRSASVTRSWQRELRAQAWDDAALLTDADELVRQVAFKRIELAVICEIKRIASSDA